jgi:hypothetical protein
VAPLPDAPLGPLLDPPPDPAQLETPAVTNANSTTSNRAFRRRFQASGSRISPQTSGNARRPNGSTTWADELDPVEISTVTFPVTPALSVSVVGLKVHSTCDGRVPHWKVKVPAELFKGVITSV